MSDNNEEKWKRPKDTYKKMELEKKAEEKIYSKEEWEEIFTREREENRVQKEREGREAAAAKSKVRKNKIEKIAVEKITVGKDESITKNIITAGIVLIIVWFVLDTMRSNYYHNKEVENFKKEMEIAFKTIDSISNDSLKTINKKLYQGSNFNEQKKSFLSANNRKPAKKWKRTFWEVKKGYGCINNKCTYQVMQYWKDCKITTGKCNTQSREIKRTSDYLKNTKVTYL